MIRYLVDAAAPPATPSPSRCGSPGRPRAAPQPAGVDPRQLPGARVRAPPVGAARASRAARDVPLEQLDKASWLARCDGAATLVAAATRSTPSTPRCAPPSSTRERGFFNGTSLCLRVDGREARAARGSRSRGLPRGWQVATALRAAAPAARARATSRPTTTSWSTTRSSWAASGAAASSAGGVAHEFVVAGALPDFDGERLLADAQRICEAQIAFWHGARRKAAVRALRVPAQRGRRRLRRPRAPRQHRADRARGATCRAQRRRAERRATATSTLLGLISHEYFHTWNVKRLQPPSSRARLHAARTTPELLWFFEGFTSLLRRPAAAARRPDRRARATCKLLAKTINARARHAGPRRCRAWPQASFDAWVKYYRSDENTPNATISYYTKGALVALALRPDAARRRPGHRSTR